MQQGISINITPNGDKEQLSHNDFVATRGIDHIDEEALAFYAALDFAKNVCGTAQVSAADRKAVGALVGNWIAQGYAVHRMTFKELKKLLDRQQKAKDAQDKADADIARLKALEEAGFNEAAADALAAVLTPHQIGTEFATKGPNAELERFFDEKARTGLISMDIITGKDLLAVASV